MSIEAGIEVEAEAVVGQGTSPFPVEENEQHIERGEE
jgi:hypothetical protein